MLISFILPASILSHKNREKLLLILDATGKYSILDSYISIMMVLGYHFLIEIPFVQEALVEKGFTLDIVVFEPYGFLSLLAGILISMFLSHLMTHLNRNLKSNKDENNNGENAENKISIMSFTKIKIKKINEKSFRIIISVLLVITLGLFLIGLFMPGFSFYYYGLVGYVLNVFEIPTDRVFAIFDIGWVLPDGYEDGTDSAIIFTQVFFFLSVQIFPLLFLIFLGILWFIPLKRKTQKILYFIAEILNAWSCHDVFIIALIASVTGVEKFTKFIIDEKCKAVNPLIKEYFSDMLDGYNTCIQVKGSTNEGCWLYFSMVIFLFILSIIILKECRKALNERLFPEQIKEVKENLKIKKEERISRISNINDSISRTSIISDELDNSDNNKSKNLLDEE